MLLNKNMIRVMSYVHKSDLPRQVKIIIACSNNAGWQKVETLMMYRLGSPLAFWPWSEEEERKQVKVKGQQEERREGKETNNQG